MLCKSCGINFHPEWTQNSILWNGNGTNYFIFVTNCPSCREYTMQLHDTRRIRLMNGYLFTFLPQTSFRKSVHPCIPQNFADDYAEACKVISISEKASAALSRRCLQKILHAQGYIFRDLFQEINALLNEKDPQKAIPSSLRTTIDAIRHFGNFSAHPITDLTTSQIIEVEADEADWCLTIVEELFDHFYVRPKLAADMKAALDIKLAAAGKKPSL